MVRTLRRLGYRFAIVSGGFTQITDRLAADLGIHYARANTLEIVDSVLTGRVIGEIVDRAAKTRPARVRHRDRRPAGGHGRDRGRRQRPRHARRGRTRHRLQRAPVVREAADTAVNVPYLDTIMYLLGISREEMRPPTQRPAS